jgi:glycopeptide antibiotics resistance protein
MQIMINSLFTVLFVTACVAAFVVLLPIIDRSVCKKLGLNLQHGLSINPKATALLKLRQLVLYGVFALYMLVFAFLVFFSRSATESHLVHVAPFADLRSAFESDTGFVEIVLTIFREGFAAGISHVRLLKPEDLIQVYLNIMLFIPIGYLLPYVFPWVRRKVRIRPVVCCFLISFLTENMQLIFRRGLYDIDDLFTNTIGGLIGQFLFISIAFVVTHPDWRKELRAYHRWKRHARHRTLYPFARKIGLSRTTLLATDNTAIWDFYVNKLGFRVVKQIVPLDSDDTEYLLEMGSSQVEIRCSNCEEELPQQYLTISARNLDKIQKRLQQNGIETSAFQTDPYTDLRCLFFFGPDNIRITVIEQP